MAGRIESAQRWRQHAVEVLTIVVGILLALAAESGRQYFADRADEREILAALRVEFAADVEELRTDQERRAEKLAALELLSAVSGATVDGPLPDSLAAAVFRSMDWRYYTASHPVLDDLVSTGRLGLIRSDELRRALMAFGQERARISVVEQEEREFVSREVEPYLAARLDLEALSSRGSPERHATALRAVRDLLTDTTFGSLLYLNRFRTEGSIEFAATLLETISGVREALGEQG